MRSDEALPERCDMTAVHYIVRPQKWVEWTEIEWKEKEVRQMRAPEKPCEKWQSAEQDKHGDNGTSCRRSRAADKCGDEYTNRERNEENVNQCQSVTIEFATSDSAQKERHCGNRQKSEKAINGVERSSNEFAENNIIALQIRQE